MTAILEPDTSQAGILQAMLHGSASFRDMDELRRHLEVTPHEFAVVVGPSVPADVAAEFAQWARVQRPDLGVILLRDTVNSDALALALRSGMREVVGARDLAGVTTAVQRARSVASAIGQTLMGEAQAAADAAKAELEAEAAAAQAAAAAPTGTLHTVFSTKGGVGKSLVATNVAVALADAGRRVCLVDLDVNSGDVAIMLQLNPTRTINDLAGFRGVIDEGAIDSVLTKYSDNLSIVAAPIRLDGPEQATAEDVGKLLDALKYRFEVVVVDTSGVFDDHALTALDRSDSIVLVGTLDIPALKGLRLATNTLELLNFAKDTWRFVLNRADGRVGLSVDEYESTLSLKADITLVSANEVLNAVNRGEPLVRAYSGHQNSKALARFATNLAGSSTSAAHTSDTGGRKASRLRRRKG
ncbi:AAA family ATPase [Nocardioides sp. STR2]|uniref:AAA family ATPase n=1 Tax=Nocardioides pini TaxID=2975053 RepID=A0ABT4CF02_9ACTN|nr:AAA family ATPase [Nocardioides pini]MCY4727545.1 AAA family ATPase [Nocardioides pini]